MSASNGNGAAENEYLKSVDVHDQKEWIVPGDPRGRVQ
jgi:hypothetical protein